MTAKFFNSENGNISILLALGLSMMALLIGVAIDINSTVSTRLKMQNSLDAAVLAAAIFVNEAEDEEKANYSSYGLNAYQLNLSENRLTDMKVSFDIVDQTELKGTVTGFLPAFFGAILPKSALRISVESSVNIETTESPACIIALSETASPGIAFNANTNVLGNNCEMHVHSTNPNAMVTGSAINVSLEKTCLAGSQFNDNSNGGLGSVETNCEVAPDPFLGVIPEPSSVTCDFPSQSYDSSFEKMKPGTYCGHHNFNNSSAEVIFDPGLYVIKDGGWNINSKTWIGEGVTFYFYDDSQIQFNSGVKATMSAPDTGPYKDIFITEKAGLTRKEFILNDSKGFDFEGTIYLPSKHIIINSGSTVQARKMKLIGDTIAFDGSFGLEPLGNSASKSSSLYLME